jgi:hypothetical protein
MKNKHFFNNDIASVSNLMMAMLFALLFATGGIAYFMGEIYGVKINAPNLSSAINNGYPFASDQNFKDCSADVRATSHQLGSVWNYSCNIGMILTSNLLNLDSSYGYLLINNVKPDVSGLYQNTYVINNTATNMLGRHGSYCIALKYTGGLGHNEVCFWDDGIHIPRYGLNLRMYTGDIFFLPYPNVNQITHPTIKTVYKDAQFGSDLSLQVYFNNVKVIDTTALNPEDNIAGFLVQRYYAGISSATIGFALENFNTEGTISSSSSPNVLSQISGFIYTVWAIASFSLPATVPFPVGLSFLYDIMIFGIFLCIVMIWRGVG